MTKKLQKSILILSALMLFFSGSVFAQSNRTIPINGTNDTWTAAETFTDVSNADNAYFTWDDDYLYFGISDADADYGNMATFMYFDTDPQGTKGTTDGYAWTENIITPFNADYVVVWKNVSGGDYIEVRQWNSGTTSWDQVASASAASLSSGNYVVDFATAAEPDGNYREVRIKRSTIGSPNKIKTCTFTEQQWPSNFRYFAWPSEGWTDGNRASGQTISHYYGYTLTNGLSPNDANAYDAVLVDGIYGNSYSLFNNGTRGCFRIEDASDVLDVTDFTLEAWVYIDESNAHSKFIVDRVGVFTLYIISAKPLFNLDGTGNTITTSSALALNAWYHIAVVGSDGTTTMYVNGNSVASQPNTLKTDTDADIIFNGQVGYFWPDPTSKIDEIRFSNAALYTANFTISNLIPLGAESTTIFYIQFDNNTDLPPLDKGPLGLTTLNGETDLSNPVASTHYIAPPSGLPLPVELTSFTSTSTSSATILNWETATEVNNYGFDIESSNDSKNWNVVGFVEGHGNSNSPNSYSFIATDNSQYYRLKQVDTDGGFEYSEVVEVAANLSYKLAQNYPNPFNPTTQISFSIPEVAKVQVTVYNSLGQEVAELANREFAAGNHSVNFNASGLSSGLYFYRLSSANFSKTMKMLLLK